MAESVMLERAKEFAVSIVSLCYAIKDNKREGVLSAQLLKAGTSIGANIHESKYAQSTADFVSKMQIALKESYETEYWLEILHKTKFICDEDFKRLRTERGAIRRMLISSINTSKKHFKREVLFYI